MRARLWLNDANKNAWTIHCKKKKKKHESVNTFSNFNISKECSYRKIADKLAN